MAEVTLESLYQLSHLYDYVPMKQYVSTELYETWHQQALPIRWSQKILAPATFLWSPISLRSGLTFLTTLQFFVCFLNLQILLGLVGWFDAGMAKEEAAVVSPEAVELLEILFSGSFQPWLAPTQPRSIKPSTLLWFALRFFFSILAITHLLVLLRCFSICRTLRTIQLYGIEATLCLAILLGRVSFVIHIDPTYSTTYKCLYILCPFLEFLFNCLIIAHLNGFQLQQRYVLGRLATEWPYQYGFKHYIVDDYVHQEGYHLGLRSLIERR